MSSVSFFRGLFESILDGLKLIPDRLLTVFAGDSNGDFMDWLSRSWLVWFFVLVVAGAAVNLIIYVIRWRPHWWWLAKKRLVVEDHLVAPPTASRRRKPSTIIPKKQSPMPEESRMFDTDSEDLMDLKPSKKRK